MPQTVVYGPLTLPSGKQIRFRRPNGLDRFNVIQGLQITQEDAVKAGILLNNYQSAKVVTEVDGAPAPDNYKLLFNDWDDADITYYQAIYTEMFGLTDEKMNEVKSKAAFLLSNSTSSDGSSSANSADSQSGSPLTTT